MKRNPNPKMPGGSVSGCIKRERKRGRVRDPGAYCAAIADDIEPGWRSKRKKTVARRRLTRNATFDIQAFNKLTPAQKKKYRAARKAGKTAAQAMRAAKTSSAQTKARKAKRGRKSSMTKAQRERLSASSKAARKKATKKKATKKKATKKKATKKKATKKKTAKRKTSKKKTSKKKTSSARDYCLTAAEKKKIRSLMSQIRKLLKVRKGEPKKARDSKAKARKLLREQYREILAAAACRMGVQRAKAAGQDVKARCPAPPRNIPKSAYVLGSQQVRVHKRVGYNHPATPKSAAALAREFMKK